MKDPYRPNQACGGFQSCEMLFEDYQALAQIIHADIQRRKQAYLLMGCQDKQSICHASRSDLSGILLQRSFIKAAEDDLVARQLFRTRERYSQLYVVNFLVSGLVSLVLQWHGGGFRETPRQLAELATELLTRNLITTPFD